MTCIPDRAEDAQRVAPNVMDPRDDERPGAMTGSPSREGDPMGPNGIDVEARVGDARCRIEAALLLIEHRDEYPQYLSAAALLLQRAAEWLDC